MPSKIQVDQIAGATGSTVTLPSGQTLDLSSGTVTLPNSAVNLTTKVTGTLPVANGGTGLATLGTASQELRVNSGGTALEYYTPTVATSDFVLLATTTASSSSTISFDGYFSSTYDTYILKFYDIYGSADAQLYLRYRRSNADVTASNYKTMLCRGYTDLNGSNNFDTTRSSWNASGMALTSGDGITNQATSARVQGEIILFNPLNTATYKAIQSTISFQRYNYSDTMHLQFGYSRLEDSTSALSGLTFYPSAGNFVTGKFKLYGIK